MQIEVHNTKAEKVGTVDLPEAIFDARVKNALLWEQVKAQLASKRAGTHKTKNRAETSGTGMKPHKQKGGGRARQGSLRAPHFVGGGRSHGPTPLDYSYRLPRSARRSALRSALTLRLREKNLMVLDNFDLDAPKTKEVVAFLKTMGTPSVLIVDRTNENLSLSTGNVPKVKWLEGKALNVHDILKHTKLVMTKAALEDVIAKASAGLPAAGEA